MGHRVNAGSHSLLRDVGPQPTRRHEGELVATSIGPDFSSRWRKQEGQKRSSIYSQ